MVGSMLAGTTEAPGEASCSRGGLVQVVPRHGQSVAAMARGSADRYFQQDIKDQLKLVPEGIEGQVAYKGPARDVLHQLVGGLKAAMGYTGAATLVRLPCAAPSSSASPTPGSARAMSTTSRSPAKRRTTRRDGLPPVADVTGFRPVADVRA